MKKTNTNNENVQLKLKKSLAKIILDTKYEFKCSQACIDKMLFRFQTFFSDGIELLKVIILFTFKQM